MKRIILCADDYGQNSAISQAIVELLEKKRLTATSCLSTFNSWPNLAKELKPYQNQADIGLHFNLTEGKPLSSRLKSFHNLPKLIGLAFLRLLDKEAIAQEFNAQLDSFIAATGLAPRFIDGHQHIHQLPVIRDIILKVYEKRLRKHAIYFRSTYVPNSLSRRQDVAYVKQNIIQLCGAKAFDSLLNEYQIPHNTSFAGIYDFKLSKDFSTIFPRLLNQIQDGGLIMCHPGAASQDADVISNSRNDEFNYFSSDKFLADCEREQIKLVRFNGSSNNR